MYLIYWYKGIWAIHTLLPSFPNHFLTFRVGQSLLFSFPKGRSSILFTSYQAVKGLNSSNEEQSSTTQAQQAIKVMKKKKDTSRDAKQTSFIRGLL